MKFVLKFKEKSSPNEMEGVTWIRLLSSWQVVGLDSSSFVCLCTELQYMPNHWPNLTQCTLKCKNLIMWCQNSDELLDKQILLVYQYTMQRPDKFLILSTRRAFEELRLNLFVFFQRIILFKLHAENEMKLTMKACRQDNFWSTTQQKLWGNVRQVF